MAFNVTQCPVCESTFNTNARILESAAGRVRCGACLAVFDAAKNYTEEPDNDSGYHADESVFVGNDPQRFFDPSLFLTRSSLTEVDDTATSIGLENRDKEASVDEDLLTGYQQNTLIDKNFSFEEEPFEEELDEDTLHEEKFGEETLVEQEKLEQGVVEKANEPQAASETLHESSQIIDFSEQDYELAANLGEGPNEEPPNAPEHKWELLESHSEDTEDAIEINDEDTDKFTQIESADAAHPQMGFPEEDFKSEIDANPEVAQDDYEEQLKTPILDWSAFEGESSPTEPSPEAGDETSLTIESITDDDQESESESETEHSAEPEPPQDMEAAEAINAEEIADEQSTEQQPEESTEAIRARALDTALEDEEALEAIPEENLAVLGKMSTPLELPLAGNSRWGRRIALSFSILFLGSLLAAQFLWQRIDIYSQHAQVRPFYELTCSWMHCELPDYSEIAAIRSDRLVVRSHPELANGLMVNTTIRNTADFPQAFPIMVLSFNSASNSIVALREFSPDEYLDPGLQSFSTMPVMTPVQIDLEIIDPGPDAVNYTLAFRLP